MTKILLAVLLSAVAAPSALAHEGHEHKVMGKVAVIHENHLEVKPADGKTSTFMLNAKTKILKGQTPMKPEDIKAGDRVVVTATETKDEEGKATLIATEVRLGAAPATTTQK